MGAATYDLSGRIAVVTGANGGFGMAICRRLEACGATIVRWDLRQDDRGDGVEVDVTDQISVERAAAVLREQHGRLDILVNNAGIVGDVRPTWEIPVEEFRRILDVNLFGSFLVCRSLVPLMIESAARSGFGRVVNMASIQAKEGMHMAAAYSAAKAGLVALTKSLGKELAPTEFSSTRSPRRLP